VTNAQSEIKNPNSSRVQLTPLPPLLSTSTSTSTSTQSPPTAQSSVTNSTPLLSIPASGFASGSPSSISPRTPKTEKLCDKCKKSLIGSSAVDFEGKQFHDTCFTCTSCAKPLPATFSKLGALPYCPECGKRVLNEKKQKAAQQISPKPFSSSGSLNKKDGTAGLLQWCKNKTAGYPGVEVTNFTTCWANGLAFCALVDNWAPEKINFHSLPSPAELEDKQKRLEVCKLAMTVAEQLGVHPLLDPEDVVYAVPTPEKLSMMTYLSEMYKVLSKIEPKK